MEKSLIVNHLKDMANSSAKASKAYEENGNEIMHQYKYGVKDGLEIAIEWVESLYEEGE